MSKPRPLIAGNWKMNGWQADGLALTEAICAGAGDLEAELLLCPPATLIALVGEKIKGSGIALGGQDCHWAPSGAYTGDIAAPMLADLGCRYVILGHSERRHGSPRPGPDRRPAARSSSSCRRSAASACSSLRSLARIAAAA